MLKFKKDQIVKKVFDMGQGRIVATKENPRITEFAPELYPPKGKDYIIIKHPLLEGEQANFEYVTESEIMNSEG